jgi:hypothetical protein
MSKGHLFTNFKYGLPGVDTFGIKLGYLKGNGPFQRKKRGALNNLLYHPYE